MGRAFDRAEFIAAPKNYIINGAMQVSQQNGTTAGGGASGYYPVDQFYVAFVNGGVVSAAQVASASPAGSTNRMRVTVTAADAAVAASDYLILIQNIEGLRAADLQYGTANAKTSVLRFGCKGPAGTYCIAFINNASNRTYIAEYTISAGEANTDVVKSVVIPGDTTGTWLKDNGLGIQVRWGLMAGSTFQQAAGSWGTVNAVGSSNQFNFMGTINNVFELFDVGLYAAGLVPSQFVAADYPSELLLCKRYFETGVEPLWYSNLANGLIYGYGDMKFQIQKRAAPTMTLTGWQYYNAGSSAAFTPLVSANQDRFTWNASGLTNWQGWVGTGTWSADARL